MLVMFPQKIGPVFSWLILINCQIVSIYTDQVQHNCLLRGQSANICELLGDKTLYRDQTNSIFRSIKQLRHCEKSNLRTLVDVDEKLSKRIIWSLFKAIVDKTDCV